jgi:3-oxoacyl-[acyl-carrier-protein] synthase II
MRRSVITGIGVVSPLGCDLKVFWDRMKSGQSGIKPVTKFDVTGYDSRIAGQVEGFDPTAFIEKKEVRRMDEFCHFAVAAAKMAIADSGLDMSKENPERAGVIAGSGIGGLQTLQTQHSILLEKGPSRCSPFMIPMMITNIAAGLIAIRHNMKGPNFSIITACATGLHSVGEAMKIIQRDDADIMVVGGAEAAVCELGLAGFSSMGALSVRNDEPTRASRPFDAERNGFVIAEGAGIVVVEEMEHARRRNAQMYCEVAGFGMTCDAFHITAPDEDGDGARRAMQLAIRDAGLNPGDIQYINAHGTSTKLNDKIETLAIKKALGEEHARRVMVSSTKSMTGHLLGAAGGIETAVCALALRDGVVPPTINYENPDPECDLDYVPNQSRDVKIKACLNNSLGFGGHNGCLAMRRMD